MVKLTARQQEVLDIIKDSIRETGYPPTRADIAKIMGFKSVNSAEEHLRALAKKGVIEIIAGTSRGIKLLDADEDLGIPIIGRVAAGEPVLAEQHIDDHCDISSNFFHPPADYLLRVRGTSMKDIGILDGDLLAVHSTQHVKNGDIVIARIGEDVTVKRYMRVDEQTVHLIAENDEFDPIVVDLANEPFNIEGLSVGVLRN